MSRFFVGQRVRLVHASNWKQLVGREYRVAALDVRGWAFTYGSYVGCELDGNTPSGHPIVAPYDCLEPILLEDDRACDEEFKRDLDKLLEGLPA